MTREEVEKDLDVAKERIRELERGVLFELSRLQSDTLHFERERVSLQGTISSALAAAAVVAEAKGVADVELIRGWVREKIGGR